MSVPYPLLFLAKDQSSGLERHGRFLVPDSLSSCWLGTSPPSRRPCPFWLIGPTSLNPTPLSAPRLSSQKIPWGSRQLKGLEGANLIYRHDIDSLLFLDPDALHPCYLSVRQESLFSEENPGDCFPSQFFPTFRDSMSPDPGSGLSPIGQFFPQLRRTVSLSHVTCFPES